MAQGEFTKEEADIALESVEEIFNALPKTKRISYLGNLNDSMLFLEAAKRAAPAEVKK